MKGKTLMPKVAPIDQPEWGSKQSKYPTLPEAGISHGLLVAPSFTGKTTWLSSWLLDWYRGAYARIYIFSPNAFTPEWAPVKDYIAQHLWGWPRRWALLVWNFGRAGTQLNYLNSKESNCTSKKNKSTKRCTQSVLSLMTWPVNQHFIKTMEA